MADVAEVLAEFGPVLARVAATYAAAGADRDDLLQEIAMGLVTALPLYRGDSSLRTYVLRVAHNCGVRRRAAGTPLEESQHPTAEPGPERQALARQDVERLAAAVRELSLGLRQVLVLTLEGLSQREIAEVLGLAESVVSVRLHRQHSGSTHRARVCPGGILVRGWCDVEIGAQSRRC